MPVFPRYQGSVGVQTPNTPAAPEDPTGQQVYRMGRQIEQTNLQVKEALDRRQEFKDETLATQRYMDAVTDLEGVSEELDKPENALNAKEYFDQALNERRPKWYEGLSGGAQLKLERKLFPKMLEYKVNAGKRENRALGDLHEAEYTRLEEAFVDRFSRGVGPDGDGRDSEEYQILEQYVDNGVRMGYRGQANGEKTKELALTKAAYARGNRLVESESGADLQQYIDMYQREKSVPGSTFLRNIDPVKRDDMNRKAYTRQFELREKREVESKKALKENSDVFTNRVLRSLHSQDPKDRLSDAQIDQGLSMYESVMPRETTEALLRLRNQPYLEGGTTNFDIYHRIKIDVLAQDRPVSDHEIVRYAGQGLSSKHVEELIRLNKDSSTEAGVEKTAFFKEGKEHLRTLVGGVSLPGMEWMMRPVNRRAYSDALFTFAQHARKVYASGDSKAISELPAFARNLAASMRPKDEDGGGAAQPGDKIDADKLKTDRSKSPKPAFAQ